MVLSSRALRVAPLLVAAVACVWCVSPVRRQRSYRPSSAPMLSQLSVGAMRRTTALMRPLTVGQSTAVRRVSTAVPRAGKPSLGTPVTPAAKPRAAKTARSSGGSNTTKAALAVAGGTVLGLGGYWGYFLYSTQQHPVEWAKSVVKNAWSAYQDVADPSEEFIRNSIQVGAKGGWLRVLVVRGTAYGNVTAERCGATVGWVVVWLALQPIHMMQAQGFVGTVIVDLEDTVLNRQWDVRGGGGGGGGLSHPVSR